MNETLLVVMQCCYDYDNSWATPILVTSSKDKAEAKIKEMTDRRTVRNAAMTSIQAHMTAWRAANPQPVCTPFKEKALPNYGSKRNKWSAEQLAEHKSIKDHNQGRRAASIKPLQEWAQLNLAEDHRVTATFPRVVQEDIRGMDDDTCWEIEEVPYED